MRVKMWFDCLPEASVLEKYDNGENLGSYNNGLKKKNLFQKQRGLGINRERILSLLFLFVFDSSVSFIEEQQMEITELNSAAPYAMNQFTN